MLPFIKMHGAGNDYVYLDGFSGPIPSDAVELARRVSDRHRGIGSDGLVLMLPSDVPGTTARMRMFNADGSEGSLCGNALRCMAMWLHQSGRCGTACRISMMNRTIDATILESDAARGTAVVRMILGQPVSFAATENNDAAAFGRFVRLDDLTLPELIVPILEVSMGNSHTVLFIRSIAGCDVHGIGRQIEHHPIFPERTNVEFVEVTGSSAARVRVWERGSGETQACGSGACAVGVAGIIHGLFHRNDRITIGMPGGDLRVCWRSDNCVELEGPAAISFHGELRI